MVQTAPPASGRRAGRHGKPAARKGLLLLLVMVLLILGVGVAGASYYQWCQGASGAQRPVTLTIPPGTSATGVVSALHANGVIRCGGLMGRVILYRKGSPEFRAGTFHLSTNMTFDEAVGVLTRQPHRAKTVKLTIPEGYRLTRIAARVQRDLGIPAKRFMRVATNGTWSLPPYLPKGTKTTEGFLFPETYQVPVKTATPSSIIRELLGQFGDEVRSLPWRNAARLGVTPYQVVIIASMIEKEAYVDRDRPLISAVIYNRLKLGMRLGIDATLLYDDPTPGDHTLSASDLLSNSPYNTRRHTGLPPTPIASPRLASIKAALEPAHVPYLYYVLCPKDGKGVHRFSVTNRQFVNDEHQCLGS
jgi:UPF0755 protein